MSDTEKKLPFIPDGGKTMVDEEELGVINGGIGDTGMPNGNSCDDIYEGDKVVKRIYYGSAGDGIVENTDCGSAAVVEQTEMISPMNSVSVRTKINKGN